MHGTASLVENLVGQPNAVGLEVPEGTLGELDDLNRDHMGLQSRIDGATDGIDGVAIFQHHIQIGDLEAFVLGIRDDDEELIHDAGDVGICDTVLHGQNVQEAAAVASVGATTGSVDVALRIDMTDVAHVQPELAVLVTDQNLFGGLDVVVAQHNTRAGNADLTGLVVAQLLSGAGLEDGNGGQRHGAAHVAHTGRTAGNMEGQVGASLAGAVAGGEGDLGVVISQELVDALDLGIVAGLSTGTHSNQMGDVVIGGNALGVHQNFNEHGDHGPVVGLVAHQLQVDILHIHPGIQDQQLVGGQGQQHHGNNDRNQSGGQDGMQPGAAGLLAAVEIHLGENTDDGVCGVDDLLGSAGGAAGIAAVQGPVDISGSIDLTVVVIAQSQELMPGHGILAACTLVVVQTVQALLDVLRHITVLAGVAGIHQHKGGNIGGGVILIQCNLRQEAVGKEDLGIGILHCLCIFINLVVTAENGSADPLSGQQQRDKLGHGTQENGDLITDTDAQNLQGFGDAFCSGKNQTPGDIGAIVVDCGSVQAGHIVLQILGQGAGGNLQMIHQNGGIILQPGLVNAGLASQVHIHGHVITS